MFIRKEIVGLFLGSLGLLAGCTRGIQLSAAQKGGGLPGSPGTTIVSSGGAGSVVSTPNLTLYIRTTATAARRPDAAEGGVRVSDPALESGIQQALTRAQNGE